MTVDYSKLDAALGYIHELALRLHLAGYSNESERLATAHEDIQKWVIDTFNIDEPSENPRVTQPTA